jgi:hypothetical protein
MPKEVKQPVAISFLDYRDGEIVDFFANENRSFQPDIQSGSSGNRLNLVVSPHTDILQTTSTQTSIRLNHNQKNTTNKQTKHNCNKTKLHKSTPKPIAVVTAPIITPPTVATTSKQTQINNTIFNKTKNKFEQNQTGKFDDSVDIALSKQTRSIASLIKLGQSIVNKPAGNIDNKNASDKHDSKINDTTNDAKINTAVDTRRVDADCLGGGVGIRVGNLEFPVVEAPVLQPLASAVNLQERLRELRKKSESDTPSLRLVVAQAKELQQEAANAAQHSKESPNKKNKNHKTEPITHSNVSILANELCAIHGLRIIDIDNRTIDDEYNSENDSDSGNENENDDATKNDDFVNGQDVTDEDTAARGGVDDSSESEILMLPDKLHESKSAEYSDRQICSIKYDKKLLLVVNAWSNLSDQVKENIIAVIKDNMPSAV